MMVVQVARLPLAIGRRQAVARIMLRSAGGALMAGRAVRRFGWAVVPLAFLGFGLYLALGISGPTVSGPAVLLDDVVWVLGQVAYATVGALVASRRPELPIGWLYCIAGLLGLFAGIRLALPFTRLPTRLGRLGAVQRPGFLHRLVSQHCVAGAGGLLFPSGRPPSRGWWAVAWALGAGTALAAIGMGLLWPVRGIELLDASPASSRAPLGSAFTNVALLIQAGSLAATVVALLVRLRRARGVERPA